MRPLSRTALAAALAGLALGGCGDGGGAGSPEPPPRIVAAGDIADCGSPGDEATAALLDGLPGTILVLGDTAYETGLPAEFEHCYGPTWGKHRERTRAVPGNHEYSTPDAAGFYEYFAERAGPAGKGWFSFDLGGWHIVGLNSNRACESVACDAGSEQERWLREDLEANRAACTAAFLHHPLFSAVKAEPAVLPLWQAFYDHGVDVVLAGHAHAYQRFTPLTPAGEPDFQRGIRQFVVGTGGRALDPLPAPAPHTEAWSDDAWGVLTLELKPGGYTWRFVPVAGAGFTDGGSARCSPGR